jgi:hypothetical protein
MVYRAEESGSAYLRTPLYSEMFLPDIVFNHGLNVKLSAKIPKKKD